MVDLRLQILMEDLLLRFSIAEAIDLFHSARYNVAPMQMTPVVINDGKEIGWVNCDGDLLKRKYQYR